MMTADTAPDYGQKKMFEDVWAILREVAEGQKETKQQMKENAEQLKETREQMKETDKRMGYLTNRFGEIAEHLVAPGTAKSFNELGFHFETAAPGGHKIYDEQGKVLAEVDVLLENDNAIMAVEIKVKPDLRDVEETVSRLEIVGNWRRKKNDQRKMYGAIAGAIFGAAAKKATARAGLYVIEQSGDTMKIDVPKGFTPREW